MEPIFPDNSILIFDPETSIKDRSYVLAFIQQKNISVFRQLLIDVDQKHLKPLHPDLSAFEMLLLDIEDIIIASLVESRMDHRLSKLIKLKKIRYSQHEVTIQKLYCLKYFWNQYKERSFDIASKPTYRLVEITEDYDGSYYVS